MKSITTVLPAFVALSRTVCATSVETRTIDEIYQAALAEGGVVTCWHGGDEPGQQDGLKKAFETRFPGMTLNITVDLSKYHDGNIDKQLQAGNVYVDSAILQTLHDYPRWAQEGALLPYAPLGFDRIYPELKAADATSYGVYVFGWSTITNTNKIKSMPIEWPDFLKPEYKDKLILTYPNDDDAVLFAFDLILQQYGDQWLDALIAQNPHWVRGTATPTNTLLRNDTQWSVTFTSSIGLVPFAPVNNSLPTQGQFVSWPQTAAILKDAPHPEGAKLLHNFVLSEEYQNQTGSWSVLEGFNSPGGFPTIMNQPGTNVTAFGAWMSDRARVERLRFWYEGKLGTAQGVSPLSPA